MGCYFDLLRFETHQKLTYKTKIFIKLKISYFAKQITTLVYFCVIVNISMKIIANVEHKYLSFANTYTHFQ